MGARLQIILNGLLQPPVTTVSVLMVRVTEHDPC